MWGSVRLKRVVQLYSVGLAETQLGGPGLAVSVTGVSAGHTRIAG